jgi:6-phosphogluconolactonase (cycloisomerase 2 family)
MRTIRILVTLLLICVSTSFAQTTSSPTVAFVYLGGRESEHPIRAFSLQANGSAHLVPGSPFTTAALTDGTPQTLVAASTNFVYASDTEAIATFRRSSNGALTFVSSVFVTNTAIIDTLTLDRTASNLYAGGGRFENTHYFVFNKGTQGQLTAASVLPGVQADGELQFEHNNKFAYTTYFPFLNLPDLPGNQYCTFEAYSRTADGSLNPFDPALTRPTGVAASDFCPASAASSALGYLAVAYRTLDVNRFVGTGVHSIAVYRILTSGDLQFVSKLVTTLDATLPVTMKFDPSGTFLAVAGKQGIQLYKLSSAGTLTKSGPALYTHTNFRDVRWDRSGHVITISFGAVYFFGLKNGQLVQTNPPIYISFAGIRDLKVVSLQ